MSARGTVDRPAQSRAARGRAAGSLSGRRARLAHGNRSARPSLLRFTTAFDDLLAPIFSCLDNFDAYLDPRIAPPDFLEWLAGWIGVELDETWTLDRRRDLVLHAVDLYRWRGTARGLAEAVAVFTGTEPEIVDSGGVSWSTGPENELPGSAEPRVVVRFTAEDSPAIDRVRVEALIAAAKPAHVIAEIELEGP